MSASMSVGDTVDVEIDRMAHGGEGIATGPDGRVVFVARAYPGDAVTAGITEVKKRFARAELQEVRTAGTYRGEQRCPAAAHGAGCCDFGDLRPDKEAELKADILCGQLSRVLKPDELPELQVLALEPARGWRTRVRLGVGPDGRAGMRAAKSTEVIADHLCTQVADGLLDGLVGAGARTFTPGAEVVAVRDGDGVRHVVQTRRPARGRRTEKVEEVLEGDALVRELVDGTEFLFPATAFWQAHEKAPVAYTALAAEWLNGVGASAAPVAWDLYGGVGLFVPVLGDALGDQARIMSVDYSPAAAAGEQPGLADYRVTHVNERVEKAVASLPAPDVVVLDPPRVGAGKEVIGKVAAAGASCVIHVGCDPATFARDAGEWVSGGYRLHRLALIDAFPGTHHFEVMAELRRVV